MEKTVKLSRRYEAHGQAFDSVTIREPRFVDLMALGEPYEMQRTSNGTGVVIENIETVAGYVNRCAVNPTVASLGELDIADARAVRDAVLNFFRHGGARADKSPPKSASPETT